MWGKHELFKYIYFRWWKIRKLRICCCDYKNLTSPEEILKFSVSMTQNYLPILTLSHVRTPHTQHCKQIRHSTSWKPCTYVYTTHQATYITPTDININIINLIHVLVQYNVYCLLKWEFTKESLLVSYHVKSTSKSWLKNIACSL
jgi:hypothetical protein